MTKPDAHPPPHPRYHALDALRAGAMLLGLVLHASIPYIPDLDMWAVHEDTDSVPLLLGLMLVHSFRMQVFFVMAGFFAHLLVARRGVKSFVRNRSIRVLSPFAIAMVTIAPACLVLWIVGWTLWPPADPPEPQGIAIPTFHLWFLEYLLLMYAGTLLIDPIARALGAARLAPIADRIIASPLLPYALAVPAGLLLLTIPGWDSGPLRGEIIPEPGPLAYYSLFFLFGWVLFAHRDRLDSIARWWIPAAVVGLAAAYPALLFAHGAAEQIGDDPMPTWLDSLGHASAALLSCLLVLAITGVFLRFCNRPSPAARYISDSSYWLYLLHLPLQILASMLLYPLPIDGHVKFLLVLLITTPVMLLTYHFGVRYTPIGWMLNGRRHRPEPRTAPSIPATHDRS